MSELTGEESHYTETFSPRNFSDTVEIWCPQIDETKVVLGYRYLRHCPMCGGEIDVEKPEVEVKW